MQDLEEFFPGLYRLSANLDDEDLPLLDQRWPLPHGLTCHSYFIKGERGALIDPYTLGGYDAENTAEDLAEWGWGWTDVDVVLLTHLPADLAQWTAIWQGLNPRLQVQTTPLTAPLDLGQGKVLVPLGPGWLETSTGTFFSGRSGASFGALEDTVYADALPPAEADFFAAEARRWFISIQPPRLVCPDSVRFLAPAHGLLDRQGPARFLAQREQFERWRSGPANPEITLIWADGAEHTSSVEALIRGTQAERIDLNLFRPPYDHVSFIRSSALAATGIILGPGLDPSEIADLTKPIWSPALADPVALEAEARRFARQMVELSQATDRAAND